MNESALITTPPSDVKRRFKMFGYGVAFVAATGGTAALIPIQVILMVTAVILMAVLVAKFVADNVRLAKRFTGRHIAAVLGKTFLCFLPITILLIPGFYFGLTINDWADQKIKGLDDWVGSFVKKSVEDGTEMMRQEAKVLKEKEKELGYKIVSYFLGFPNITERIEQLEEQVEAFEKLATAPPSVRTAAGTLKAAMFAISIYSTAWMVILLIRSFASLFGRVLVAGDTPVCFSIGSADVSKHPSASAVENDEELIVGASLSVALGESERLFVRGADLPVNAPPDIGWNRCSGGLLLRLRHGLIFLNQLKGEVTGLVTEFQASGSHRYVLAQIKEGQEVVIDPARLVAFTDQIRFKSRWNFNLAALALHRPASFVARGPGQVVLKCDGQPLIFNEASTAPAMALDKLILFERDAQFEIRASKGLLNYFGASCVVQPRAGSLFVATPEPPRASSFFAKLWGLVKQVYLPI